MRSSPWTPISRIRPRCWRASSRSGARATTRAPPASAGFLIAAWAALTKIFHVPSPRGWASTMAAILFVGGVQLVMLGVVGEYLGRVYDEVRRRPLYIVRSRVGFDEGEAAGLSDRVERRGRG